MPVRVGVVGCGWWSTTAHLPAVVADDRAVLVGIADVDPDKLGRAGQRFHVPDRFERWEDLLDIVEMDALVVATPAGHHFPPARAALDRGISVLVEKPMVLNPADGAALVAAAERTGAQLSVGYTFHHTPTADAVRRSLAAGRIGEVEHVSCTFASIMRELLRGSPEVYSAGATGFGMTEVPDRATYSVATQGGGQAYSQMTHSIALALNLTGLVPAVVSGMNARFELDVDLADAFAVRFTSGALGSFDSVGNIRPGRSELLQCRVFGSDGTLAFDAITGEAHILGRDGTVETFMPLDDPYPVAAPAHNLIDLALGEGCNRATGQLGLHVVRILDAARISAKSGQHVRITDDQAGETAASAERVG